MGLWAAEHKREIVCESVAVWEHVQQLSLGEPGRKLLSSQIMPYSAGLKQKQGDHQAALHTPAFSPSITMMRVHKYHQITITHRLPF